MAFRLEFEIELVSVLRVLVDARARTDKVLAPKGAARPDCGKAALTVVLGVAPNRGPDPASANLLSNCFMFCPLQQLHVDVVRLPITA